LTLEIIQNNLIENVIRKKIIVDIEKSKRISVSGWSWSALLLGPFLYLINGLWKKGLFLLAIVLISVGLAAPFIWIYCAMRAKTDLYEQKLCDKSRFNIDKI
jgi:hypothetical protein